MIYFLFDETRIQRQFSNSLGRHAGDKKLIDKTGISHKLLELNLPSSRSNNSIDAISIIESFGVSIWIGCYRFSHTAVVRLDNVLCEIFGWKRVASGTIVGIGLATQAVAIIVLIFWKKHLRY